MPQTRRHRRSAKSPSKRGLLKHATRARRAAKRAVMVAAASASKAASASRAASAARAASASKAAAAAKAASAARAASAA